MRRTTPESAREQHGHVGMDELAGHGLDLGFCALRGGQRQRHQDRLALADLWPVGRAEAQGDPRVVAQGAHRDVEIVDRVGDPEPGESRA